MSTIWIGRIGIILDFIAAILLAPEIYGLERLRRTEERLEKSIQALRDRPWHDRTQPGIVDIVKKVLDTPSSMKLSAVVLSTIAWLATLLSWRSPNRYIALPVAVSLTCYSIYQFMPHIGNDRKPSGCLSSLIHIVKLLIWFILLLCSIPGLLIVLLLWYPIGVILRVLLYFSLILIWLASGRILRLLSGNDSLRAGINGIGIFLLILGFLLQLIGTL
jgi:hypothetical protein